MSEICSEHRDHARRVDSLAMPVAHRGRSKTVAEIVNPRRPSARLRIQHDGIKELPERLVNADVEESSSPRGDEECRDLRPRAEFISDRDVLAQGCHCRVVQREASMLSELRLIDLHDTTAQVDIGAVAAGWPLPFAYR